MCLLTGVGGSSDVCCAVEGIHLFGIGMRMWCGAMVVREQERMLNEKWLSDTRVLCREHGHVTNLTPLAGILQCIVSHFVSVATLLWFFWP